MNRFGFNYVAVIFNTIPDHGAVRVCFRMNDIYFFSKIDTSLFDV